MTQARLFETLAVLPEGMVHEPDFLSAREEADLLAAIRSLPFEEARYKEFVAKRRIVTYGGSYDFSANELKPAGPIPAFLHRLRDRIATWTGLPAHGFEHALVAEYAPGTQLGWHRDVPDFEAIVGVSLAGPARMRLRPYPPTPEAKRAAFPILLEPRSAYVIRGPARWDWQHAISPTKALRYSITFRTRRTRGPE
jgi:alkylated DNA repair dioxygenase AlkB